MVRGSDCGIANVYTRTPAPRLAGRSAVRGRTAVGASPDPDLEGLRAPQTNTVNWSEALPLAQGITFDVCTVRRLHF